MQLIKMDPFSEIDRFFGDSPINSLQKFNLDMAVDLYEEKGNIIVEMNIPNVDPDKLDLSIENNVLQVSGSREEEREEENKRYYYKEIYKGSFRRAIKLPKTVDEKNIDAVYRDGVIELTMPIIEVEEDRQTKIKIKK